MFKAKYWGKRKECDFSHQNTCLELNYSVLRFLLFSRNRTTFSSIAQLTNKVQQCLCIYLFMCALSIQCLVYAITDQQCKSANSQRSMTANDPHTTILHSICIMYTCSLKKYRFNGEVYTYVVQFLHSN